ncbi:ROK family protein [Mycolicibacillus koreensis]|uniref:ROK family protein n=1 Tax=Mycolicibacillus koreensis TaxID=1069220 RepID=UPI001F3AD175|nr:ROK family protein [Mycolicibacillus koreensis]
MTPTITTPAPATPSTRRAPRARRHHRVLDPTLAVSDGAAAAVFRVVRHHGPITRDAITAATALSTATVNRQVTALLQASLLRERTDLVTAGAIGRPRVPVEVNDSPFLTLGVHIGATTTAIVATDLLGRTLDAVEIATPHGPQGAALGTLSERARHYLTRWRRRRPLGVGVAIGGAVDGPTGRVDHARLGWTHAPVGATFADALGLPVAVASHVDAMAGAELLLGRRPAGAASTPGATSLYVYARETVGYALMIGGRVHTPAAGPGTIATLPASSELLGGSGQLESTVSDAAVLAAARRLRILPDGGAPAALLRAARAGDGPARDLLAERARVLGEAVALLRDLLNPDDLVVGGQAFTEYPEGMTLVAEAFTRRSVLPPRGIRVTAFGNKVQEAGAGVVSLSGLYADPITAMRRIEAATQV